MGFKYPFWIFALSYLLVQVSGQEFQDIEIYSTSDCGSNPNDEESLSTLLSFVPRHDESGPQSSGCMQASIDLPAWPTIAQGKYQIYVDSSNIDDNCALLFYHLDDEREEVHGDAACRSLYRKVSPAKTACGDLILTKHFGYARCCGDDCSNDISTWKRDYPSQAARAPSIGSPQTRDITQIKRASLLSRISEKRDACKYIKDEDTYTTYGRQERVSDDLPCPPEQTTCGQDFSWTTGIEITDSVNVQVTVSAEFFEVVSVELSAGYEHSETQQKSFTAQKHLGVEQGHTGYITFRPLYVCAKGHTEGDCSGLKIDSLKDNPWCVPKMLPDNSPDGSWEVVIID